MLRRCGCRILVGAQEYGTLWLILMCSALVVTACAREAGPQAFVERLGVDTMSIEVYSRTAEGFEGDVLIRSPVTRVAHYKASLTPEGTIGRMEVEWRTPPENPEGPEPMEFTVIIEADSATLDVRGGRSPGTTRLAVPPGAIPLVGKTPVAFAVFEQAVRQAIASGADSHPVHFISATRTRVLPNAITRLGGDTVSMDYFGNPILARVDAPGRVLWRSGERTTSKLVGERVSEFDFQRLASAFAARDARGEGMGVASPQATVEATVGGAAIKVVYCRPAKRGREIWGALVPWNEVWRTGANAATAFSTDRNLGIGGVRVPAGDYTLYSIFTAESAKLIINRQTGQWGTVYNQDQDLARVDLTPETLGEPVDRLTIAIESTAEGGVLQLSWDTTRFSVPIRVT